MKTEHNKIRDATKAVPRGKFIVVNTYIKNRRKRVNIVKISILPKNNTHLMQSPSKDPK